MKLTHLRGWLPALALVLAAGVHAQTIDGKPELKTEIINEVTSIIEKKAYVPGVDFEKWPEYLASAKAKIEAASTDDDFVAAVNEALSKFGTTHLDLLSPRRDEMFWTGNMVGIGVSIQRQDDGSLIIVRTVDDAPAQRAGIVAGDSIVEVDGKKINGSPAPIMGKEGTDVDITIKHGDGRLQHYILTRRAYSTVRPAELSWINSDTARLSLYTFDDSYDAERVENLMSQAHNAKNLILDLRDNGGGAVTNMEHLLGMLIPDTKPIGVFVDRRMVANYVHRAHGTASDLAGIAKWTDKKEYPKANKNVPMFHGNLVVLLNAFSGSASEISAAALRDDIGATIVGTKSAGAVLVSVVVPASNGFGFQYPLSDFVTVKGVRLEGNGIVPDVAAKEPKIRLPSDHDDALDKAIGVFAQAAKIKTGS